MELAIEARGEWNWHRMAFLGHPPPNGDCSHRLPQPKHQSPDTKKLDSNPSSGGANPSIPATMRRLEACLRREYLRREHKVERTSPVLHTPLV